MHTRAILLGVLFLSVASFAKELTPDEYAEKCFVERDDFKKTTCIFTPSFTYPIGETENRIKSFYMSGQRSDGESMRYGVIFSTYRTTDAGWARWKIANDENGKEFRLVEVVSKIDTDGSVRLKEIVSSTLTREYLESVKEKGIKWRIYGDQTVSTDIALTPVMIAGLLKRCDELK